MSFSSFAFASVLFETPFFFIIIIIGNQTKSFFGSNTKGIDQLFAFTQLDGQTLII